jgi:hypothetical protein
MFKMYKPYAQLTPAQRESARQLHREWPASMDSQRVYKVEESRVQRSYDLDLYLKEFSPDCPECHGELSLCECLENAGGHPDKIHAIYQSHSMGW